MSAFHLQHHGVKLRWFVMPFTLFCVSFGAMTSDVSAQVDTAENPQALDPADVFFQAWLTIRDAEKLEKEKEYGDAWRKYQQAAKYYDTLSRFHNNWKPHLVERRIKSTTASIKEIEPKAAAQIAGEQNKTKDLVEGGTTSPDAGGSGSGDAIIPTPRKNPSATIPRIARNPADQKVARRLQVLERENQRLKNELAKSRRNPSRSSNRAEEKRLVDQISKRDAELTTLKNILARAPLQRDMDQLTRQNRTIKAEIEITARALKESQKQLSDAHKEAAKYKENAELAKRRAEEIKKDMEAQKKIDNRVVRELRKELDTVTKMLEFTRNELGAANNKIARMQKTLEESEATIDELTKERDELRTERNTLASVLRANDSEGVQKLIAENMRLGRELKETQDRMEFLEKSNNATKDELIAARNDLAVAKNRILRYQQEQSSQNQRIKSMKQQLKDAELDLAAARSESGDSPDTQTKSEETEILRSTVKRLMAIQERQRTASKILWETYQKSQAKVAGLPEFIRDIRDTEIKLTEQEKSLLAYRRPDGEFTSPQRVSLSHARTHASALEKEIATYQPLIKRAVAKGRFEGARQMLEDMDERFPGHFPTLCNRGVVELKTQNFDAANEFFSEAITMRENSSYAHHMLGITYYEQKDLDNARKSFQRSIDLKPDNATAQLYLGILAGAGKRYKQAEQHFLTAIKLDATLNEAYFNLSVIYLQQKKKEEAKNYYAKALENGLAPRPEHERNLGA